MTEVSCRESLIEVVEAARAGAPLGAAASHVRECAACRERWEAEQALAAPIRRLRAIAASEGSSVSRRAELMQAFERVHARSRVQFHWGFAAAAAALLLFAVSLSRRGPVYDDTAAVAEEMSDDNGFTPVPYAPPLASGEFVKVVRTELYAAALDRMGVRISPAYSDQIPADVVVGEDGLPRAVRVLAQGENE
jgi:hypothetical protein